MSSPVKPNVINPPPLEKIRKNTEDLTMDLTHGSDKENLNTDSKDNESIHSLTPPPPSKDAENEPKIENNKAEAEEDEESEEESSSDDDNPLFDGLSAEDIQKLKQKMGSIQNDFKQHEKAESQRRIEDVQTVIDFNLSLQVSPELALFVDQFMIENHMDLSSKLQDEGAVFLESMQEMMEQEQQHSTHTNGANQSDMDDEDGSASDFDPNDDKDDPEWASAAKKLKAERASKRKQKNVAKNTNLDGSKRSGRLLLNDALKNIDDQSQWSDARKKAWKERQSRPNAYFYRFCVPGQPQKNGKWTTEEHKLFMQRVLEIGVNDSWGIFSKKIPGRVGYQCSNYWRGLVKDGDVRDPNYWYDGKKLHFKRNTKSFAIAAEYRRYAITVVRDKSGVFTGLPAKHPKHPSSEYCKEVEEAMKGCEQKDKSKNKNDGGGGKKTRKRKKKKGSDDDDEDEAWDGQPKSKKRRKNTRRKRNDSDDDGSDDDDEDEAWDGQPKSKKRRKNTRRKRNDSDDDGSDDDDEDEAWDGQPKSKKRRKNTRRKRNDSDDDGDDEAFYCKAPTSPKQNDDDCIAQLKDFVDIMTGMTISKPAISPYGHVLGYETWTKVLRTSKHKNMCPFTLQKMTRRSLVKLTKENYEQYKDQIINVTQEQAQLMSNIEQE
eukprot:CAMPEP_0202726412 /NCGR_PEP_ID=MMETSP1385-20130828/184599_1 /ASSEMBLY_ACC=CAM_ASM_000861 /TAXON_ID=933848 /ORGANISM="Elphidium margaritaceum" /LENGTH=657 /DNA_ID=CAMNT_0049392633 /DNA_START=52 /DNA_END=2025 /DNA_ORIENTATION=+